MQLPLSRAREVINAVWSKLRQPAHSVGRFIILLLVETTGTDVLIAIVNLFEFRSKLR